jgi:hypothetical protein
MGADIHLYFEKKVKGKWIPFTEIPHTDYPDERNYPVFGLLAGVRDNPKKVYFKGRGIPDDSSYVEPTNDEDDDDLPEKPWLGDHSFTYATIHELKKVKWEKHLEYDPQFARFIKQYFPLDTANDKNIRILMGFDS